jgi:hypothetical protein
MSTVWRIAPDQATHARVVEQAKREIRTCGKYVLVAKRCFNGSSPKAKQQGPSRPA